MTRKQQAEQQKFKIMQHALALFIFKGRGGTTIQDIASSVKMSTGLLYNYFDSKDKLYEELIRIGISGPNGVMQLDQSKPLEFFENAAQTILSVLTDEWVCKMFVFMAQALSDKSLPTNIQLMLAKQDNITASVEIIKHGQTLGQIKKGEPQALACAFWCALQGIAEHKARNPHMALPEFNWIVDIIRR